MLTDTSYLQVAARTEILILENHFYKKVLFLMYFTKFVALKKVPYGSTNCTCRYVFINISNYKCGITFRKTCH